MIEQILWLGFVRSGTRLRATEGSREVGLGGFRFNLQEKEPKFGNLRTMVTRQCIHIWRRCLVLCLPTPSESLQGLVC